MLAFIGGCLIVFLAYSVLNSIFNDISSSIERYACGVYKRKVKAKKYFTEKKYIRWFFYPTSFSKVVWVSCLIVWSSLLGFIGVMFALGIRGTPAWYPYTMPAFHTAIALYCLSIICGIGKLVVYRASK